MPDVLNLFELEKLAKEKLPQTAYDYYASGAWDEITIRGTRAAFERLQVHYHVLVDVSRRDLSTTLRLPATWLCDRKCCLIFENRNSRSSNAGGGVLSSAEL